MASAKDRGPLDSGSLMVATGMDTAGRREPISAYTNRKQTRVNLTASKPSLN